MEGKMSAHPVLQSLSSLIPDLELQSDSSASITFCDVLEKHVILIHANGKNEFLVSYTLDLHCSVELPRTRIYLRALNRLFEWQLQQNGPCEILTLMQYTQDDLSGLNDTDDIAQFLEKEMYLAEHLFRSVAITARICERLLENSGGLYVKLSPKRLAELTICGLYNTNGAH